MSESLFTATFDSVDGALLRALQEGLPLVPRPYAFIADKLQISESDVMARLTRLIDSGAIKRFGVVVRHREVGYRANAMVVWVLPENRVAEVGYRIGHLPFVTLSYRRAPRPPDWPYNLFTMIHGRDRRSVMDQVDQIKDRLSLADADCAVLFSARRFKQRGARYDAPWSLEETHPRHPIELPELKSASGRKPACSLLMAHSDHAATSAYDDAAVRAPTQKGTVADPTGDTDGGPALGVLERSFLNRFQGGFPLTPRPFRKVAAMLDSDEDTLISTIRGMLKRGLLSRFGPLYDAERLGGCLTLAAMSVPESGYEHTAKILDRIPAVAHNYRRDHRLNMWFVLATSSKESLEEAILRIRSLTRLQVYDFPKLKEYHLGFWLQLDPKGDAEGRVGVRRIERDQPAKPLDLDDLDRAIAAATQAGYPLETEPFCAIAARTDCDTSTVIDRLSRMLQAGVIRRIGAVPNHYRLGLRGNGMSVWDLDDEQVDTLGAKIGALGFVSHCYRRPRQLPLWPYNLFAMVHGYDREEVRDAATRIEAIVAGHCRGWEVLFSEAILKKTGLRFSH